ncbi:MAG: type I DNA topoisomerase [Deltaproteobacteria bacterium]|jgi:DNA topoisomerase-1|nr:type I DNA topoisomerase [Deltaproteobacteria bacterium]
MKNLLIVESPAKAKTISKYLGTNFEVMASMGHIKDLPRSKLGVNIEDHFNPTYETIPNKVKIINALNNAAKNKDTIYLASDPDREGEAIAWHIAEALGRNKHNFKRVLFHELTNSAIHEALKQPGDISNTRFESQQTRRILDRLVGYLVSPILWIKLKRGLSAGRVQSVALRLIVERERKIYAFEPEEYWTLEAKFLKEGIEFSAALTKGHGKKINLTSASDTNEVLDSLKDAEFTITNVTVKDKKRSALPPFTTSTLQQAAFTRLGFSSSRTMQLAQRLYEGQQLPEGQVGLITYMRTDSVRVSDTAANEAISYIQDNFGPKFVPEKRNFYRNKKGAQDAHEAIRPTTFAWPPKELPNTLDSDLIKLYTLIWNRFLGSQMSPALYEQTSVEIQAGDYEFRTSSSIVKFRGYLAAWDNSQDDEEPKGTLPPLAKGEVLKAQSLNPSQHFTQPPPRFNEATLVKELETCGIGRPSTYAQIIATLKVKDYVLVLRGQLRPTEMGFTVNDLLVENFPKLLDVDFTALMEENLDQIEEGTVDRLEILQKHYAPLEDSLTSAKEKMHNVRLHGIAVDTVCPKCGETGKMKIRYGRNGFYLACECGNTCDFTRDEKGRPIPTPFPELTENYSCEICGEPMVLKRGRYGPFLSCSGYPGCKNTRQIAIENGVIVPLPSEPPPPFPEGVDPFCPKCGKPMAVKRAHNGNWFLGCTNYPKCKTTKPIPTEFPCPRPDCQGFLVKRNSKRGSFWSCSNYPTCRFAARGGIPIKDPCPECGSTYRMQLENKEGEYLWCPKRECPSRKNTPEPTQRSSRARTRTKTVTPKSPTPKTKADASFEELVATSPKETTSQTTAPKTKALPKKTKETTPKTRTLAAKPKSTTTKTKETTPKTRTTAAKTKSTTTKTKETTPKTRTTAAKTKSATTKTKETTPKTRTTAAKTKSTSTKTKETTPKTRTTAAKTKSATTKTKASTVKSKTTTVKPRVATVKPRITPTRTQAPKVSKTTKSASTKKSSKITAKTSSKKTTKK